MLECIGSASREAVSVTYERGSEAGALQVYGSAKIWEKKLHFYQASYFAVMSPVARNGCAQRVY